MSKEYFTHSGGSIFSKSIDGERVTVMPEKIFNRDLMGVLIAACAVAGLIVAHFYHSKSGLMIHAIVVSAAFMLVLVVVMLPVYEKRRAKCWDAARNLQLVSQRLHTMEIERERRRRAAESEARQMVMAEQEGAADRERRWLVATDEARQRAEAERMRTAAEERKRLAFQAWERERRAAAEHQARRLRELEEQFVLSFRLFGYEAQLSNPSLSDREVEKLFLAQLSRLPIAAQPDAGLLHRSRTPEVKRVRGGRPLPLPEAPALPPRPQVSHL